MTLRSCLPLLLALALVPLRGQEDQPIHMRPELPLIFPFVNNGKDVTVKYPVLINPTTVIKPGMVLRTLFVLSKDAQTEADLAAAHTSYLDESYGRESNNTASDTVRVPPEVAHELERYRRTVWEVPNNFILFLAQYPTESTHLIYSPSNSDRDLKDGMFSFFDGLFVGTPTGKVTVIAVEKESNADKAGIKAGDQIVAIGAYPTHDDLLTFANAYSAAKKDATTAEVTSYAVQLRGADGTARTAQVSMPPRIHGGLMDGFSDKP